jgi:hypothetical protein
LSRFFTKYTRARETGEDKLGDALTIAHPVREPAGAANRAASARTAGGELAGSIGGELIADVNFTLRYIIARDNGVQFQTEETICVLQLTAFDIKREAAKERTNWGYFGEWYRSK